MAYVTLLLIPEWSAAAAADLRVAFALDSCDRADLELYGHGDNSHPGDNSQPCSIAHGILLF